MKILQINTSVNTSAPGRIASAIGCLLIDKGHESFIAYGRSSREKESTVIKIGNSKDLIGHLIYTRVFDRHGFGSIRATKRFVNQLIELNPDIIHLHNIHGYFIHIGVLFSYLKKVGKPIVWTFHDCWPFTGHCSYFDRADCLRWQSECFECPLKYGYPASWFIDNSRSNFLKKKELFTGLNDINLVSPSNWLAKHLTNSFLQQYAIKVINNGVDIGKFKPVHPNYARDKYILSGKNIILGVANIWSKRKGYDDFMKLRTILDPGIEIVLVGLNSGQIRNLPQGIRGISRTECVEDLVALYSAADVFVNPTWIDNFPTVNLEALACGTPVVTYDTGGSPESIDDKTGIVVPKGDVFGLKTAIMSILLKDRKGLARDCRSRAERRYNSLTQYSEYLKLYESLTSC